MRSKIKGKLVQLDPYINLLIAAAFVVSILIEMHDDPYIFGRLLFWFWSLMAISFAVPAITEIVRRARSGSNRDSTGGSK